MACDTTYARTGVIPLAFFRMMRDEQRRRALSAHNAAINIEPQPAACKQALSGTCADARKNALDAHYS